MHTDKPAQVIWLQAAAPVKPALGETCNGCGVCCATETCPVARVFLWQWRGPCRALEWHSDGAHYRCGMLLHAKQYLKLLPQAFEPRFQGWIRRWIAAGTACDSSAEIHVQE
ncbi:hypothetical protein RF679_13825 [Undibacterium cyanobacteriorum]|uniref:4Fe-4S ferredoxin-type domain-containing protein n=1 Tax=Undibacterium cyanobacteriorum TaxID=3073561 RepID=A0ABY9RGF5_9BURK|nr:hypothetical protein [Undibacterium sp. 20NA77.5]WMW79725.1 hypothetical protein RF679_13825 [Undibacterium sp. 20NA77.5]